MGFWGFGVLGFWGLGSGMWIGDWDWDGRLGLGIGIGDWHWGLRLGVGDLNQELGLSNGIKIDDEWGLK